MIGDTTKRKQGTRTGIAGCRCPVSDKKSVSNDDGYSIVIVIVGHVNIDAVNQLTTKAVGLDV